MPIWPVSLPGPMAGTLNVSPRENVVKSPTDFGAPITRRRYTSRIIEYSGRLLISEAQRVELDNFHHDDCEDGNLSFTMADWMTGQSITCKWLTPPQFTEAGNLTHYFASVSFVKTV